MGIAAPIEARLFKRGHAHAERSDQPLLPALLKRLKHRRVPSSRIERQLERKLAAGGPQHPHGAAAAAEGPLHDRLDARQGSLRVLAGDGQGVPAPEAGFQVFRRPRAPQGAVGEDRDPVREEVRFVQVVRRQQDRAPGPRRLEEVPQGAAVHGVEARGGLVGDDHPGGPHEGHRELQAALHPAGERVGLRVHLRMGGGGRA